MSAVIAVLSDIHGNLEALEAVLRDMDSLRPDRIAVLGDTVGYGPNPKECLERVLEIADVLLIGNHESEMIFPSDDLIDEARESLDWTKQQLGALWGPFEERIRAAGVFAEANKVVDSLHFVHAAPEDPVEQYIWPAHPCQYLIFNDQIDERIAAFLSQFKESHGFFGHTHAPAVLTGYENRAIFDPYHGAGLEWNRLHSFVGPRTLYVIPENTPTLVGLEGRKMAINPGSVGQPRFVGDRRASYALYSGDAITFRRVGYDLQRTCEKLDALPLEMETKSFLSERLKRGR